MTDRLDGYLSSKAQQIYPTALVFETEGGAWELRRAGEESIGLGKNFGEARQAVYALVRAARKETK